jgi:pyridoxal phosphate enzyme (YggS family)
MNLTQRYLSIRNNIPKEVTLVVVSKFQPVESILELYNAGQRIFGESKVQELLEKQSKLPGDIEWHFIGNLQSNKVKYITPFVKLIHSVDSKKLLEEVNKRAAIDKRIIDCLLEVHIAKEETKQGMSLADVEGILSGEKNAGYSNVNICGLMGMATFTKDEAQIRIEFKTLATLYEKFKQSKGLKYLSMGMSNDYKIAIEEGSNMVRIGTAIFSITN